jgi:hypothetical protein
MPLSALVFKALVFMAVCSDRKGAYIRSGF